MVHQSQVPSWIGVALFSGIITGVLFLLHTMGPGGDEIEDEDWRRAKGRQRIGRARFGKVGGVVVLLG